MPDPDRFNNLGPTSQQKHASKIAFERNLMDATGLTRSQVRQNLTQFASRQLTRVTQPAPEKQRFQPAEVKTSPVDKFEPRAFTLDSSVKSPKDETKVSLGTHEAPYIVEYTGDETAFEDTWELDDPPADTDGVTIPVYTRIFTQTEGANTAVYPFVRNLTFDSTGRLVLVGAETLTSSFTFETPP